MALTPISGEIQAQPLNDNFSYLDQRISEIFVNVKDYGAKGDRDTDDTAAIQNAIDSIKPLVWDTITEPKGGVVYLPPGTYRVTSPIILPSYVRLVGAGRLATEIFLSNNANCDVIKTEGYDDFIGSGLSYYDTSGVPYAFGIENLSILGNKFNNTSGGGIKIYGFGYVIKDVHIVAPAGTAFISRHERGNDTFVRNKVKLGEPHIQNLHIRDSESRGISYYGPSDAKLDGIYVGECKGDIGVLIESSVDVGLMHVYACNESSGGTGVVIRGTSRFENLISEHNFGTGVSIESWFVSISNLQLYRNCRSFGEYNLIFDTGSKFCQVSNLEIKLEDVDSGGVTIIGDSNKIGKIFVYGDNQVTRTKTGIRVGANAHFTTISNMHIIGINGTGGTGIALNQGGAVYGVMIRGIIEDCETAISPGSNSAGGSVYEIQTILESGQNSLAFALTPADTDHVVIVERNSAGTWIPVKIKVANVLKDRISGWGSPTGTSDRSAFDTSTVTVSELAERVKALIDDLKNHGLIGS